MPHPDNPPPVDTANDDESARVDIAVRALGDMRSRAAVSASSGDGRASSRSSRNEEQDGSLQHPVSGYDFVARMTSFPLVGTAIRAYEQGKASSRVYGAEMVESSVKTISKPVINRLPVNQIDEFACRQLDRLDKYRRPSIGPEPTSPRSPVSPSYAHRRMSYNEDTGSSPTLFDQEAERGRPKLRTKTMDGSVAQEDGDRGLVEGYRDRQDASLERRSHAGDDRSVPQWIQTTRSYTRSSGSPVEEDSRIGSPFLPDGQRSNLTARHSSPDQQSPHLRRAHSSRDRGPTDQQHGQSANQNPDQQIAQRSRWQAMLLEAGGLGVALSEENMRRLKYCLQWLQSATAHIDAQILILRDFIESIQPIPQPNSPSHRRPPISEEHLRKLTEVRKDIVSTIRQMVDVVSKCAGGALPEPARGKVRGFILKLPQRWATRTAASGVAVGVPVSTASGSAVAAGANNERERETVAAAGSSTGVVRRGLGREKRAAQRERGTGSRAASPSPPDLHPTLAGPGSTTNDQRMSHSNATAAAQRILSLATESLDMMRNVTGVVKDSLDRADAWVSRLRMVGVQRGAHEGASEETTNEEFGPPRIGSQYDSARRNDYRTLQSHRRGGSGSSAFDDEMSFSSSNPASPFMTTTSLSLGSGYMSNSSYTSMPSTPTGAFASPSISTSASARELYDESIANAPSPGTIPLASMHIASRFNTPKITASNLPSEDDTLEKEPIASRRSSLGRMEVDS
ncbi:Opi1-domain-containing protein [Macrolepiota fuliginosa MF-IS2]|uniref:Opi1-domain-containing protein n=1 Tax=Macrolepiota fuliginosa MF-IS2 TaxID=1400762 RepID=A0A9P5XH07_9AGAR|nr:Opi1-domain-containing protein [Macrolepiota fuliginosa MF-IS2]